jgi:ferredoxin-thioredoxin reductase catalytic subunit
MSGEFEKQLRHLNLDKDVLDNILKALSSAGDEFPCLACPSKDECNS